MPPALRAERLTKVFRVHERGEGIAAALRSVFRRRYREVAAVNELSLEVEAGTCVGFLGPNGAGKTTTLKMLAGLLHPTRGRAEVLGFEPGRRERAFLESITLVMGQKQQLLWDLPPVDTFALNRAVYGLSRAAYDEALAELDGLLGLGPLAGKPTRQLSLGERMRCELAAALLHRPRVLFLDEPTIGLDVEMKLAVREFLRTYRGRTGATILLTSHDMDDVVSLAGRLVVIDRGELRYDGGVTELVHRTRPIKRVEARFTAEIPREAAERVARVVAADGPRVTLEVPSDEVGGRVSSLLALGTCVDLTITDPPLEEVLRELFAEGRRP